MNVRTIDTAAIALTPAQARWVESLSAARRRRFDLLRIPTRRQRIPSALVWLLDVAEAGPEALSDRIIQAEVNRILGPDEPNP
jgi:hypothetical protein